MRMSTVISILGLLWLFLCTSCQSTLYQPIIESDKNSVAVSNILSTGDVVGVAFPGAIQFNQTQKIRLDGQISLPVIGEVMAAGKTPANFRNELIKQYESELQDPEVIVSLIRSYLLIVLKIGQ